jgi:hypothetical protein
MATLVKLTYTASGKSSLINLDKLNSAFRIFERNTRKYATRLNFDNEVFIIVDETLQEIQQLAQSDSSGEYQSTDWVEIDGGGMEEQMEQSYDRHVPKPRYQKRDYNNNYNNNYNRY